MVLALVMLVGLIGVLVPVLPGLLLILGAAVAWAAADPAAGRWVVVGVMGAIGIAATVAATVLPARRAAATGAPRSALLAGAAGMVVGFVAVPVVGALVGFPAGVFVAETLRLRDGRAAQASTLATLRGVGVGILIQLVAGVVMIGIWLVAAVVG